MVNPSLIGFVSILIFIVLLILIFALTGHLSENPYGILIIILIAVILIAGFMILAYYKQWWPYRTVSINNPNPVSNQNFNKIVLYISLGVLVITGILFVIVLYHYMKYEKTKNLYEVGQRYVYNREIQTFPPKKIIRSEIHPINQRTELNQDIISGGDELKGNEIRDKELLKQEEERRIERLALENKLQEEDTGLEKGSKLRILSQDRLLDEELERKNIDQNILNEALERAKLKELASKRSLQSIAPSREMFGPGGSEEIIMGTNFKSNKQLEKIPLKEKEGMFFSPLDKQEEREVLKQELEQRNIERENREGKIGSGGFSSDRNNENNNQLMEYLLLSKQQKERERSYEPEETETEEGELENGEKGENLEKEGSIMEKAEENGLEHEQSLEKEGSLLGEAEEGAEIASEL